MALRLLKGVKELRFVLCQSSQHSEPLRYLTIHQENTSHPTTNRSVKVQQE